MRDDREEALFFFFFVFFFYSVDIGSASEGACDSPGQMPRSGDLSLKFCLSEEKLLWRQE